MRVKSIHYNTRRYGMMKTLEVVVDIMNEPVPVWLLLIALLVAAVGWATVAAERSSRAYHEAVR